YDSEVVDWVGPDGTRITAIPQPQPLRDGWGAPATPTRDKVEECERRGIKNPLFIAFGDFVDTWVNSSLPSFAVGKFESGWANICQRLPAENERGKRLIFSGWVRARKGDAHLYIDAYDAKGIAKYGIQSVNCPLDNQWHFLSLNFLVPEDAVYIFPQGRIISSGEGDADFDALSLKDEEGRELLSSGSFELETLPEGWSVGNSRDVRVSWEILKGEAKEGERFFRLVMYVPPPNFKTRIVTLREYLSEMGEPKREWDDAYRGFEHRFPFALLAGRSQRADRLAENAILKTERLLSIAYAISSKPFPLELSEKLSDAWRLVLIGHHHDAWVCAPVIFGIWQRGFKSYAELTYEASKEAREICQAIEDELKGKDFKRLLIFNLTGKEREEIVPLLLSLPAGLIKNPVFQYAGKPLPADVEVLSRYPDGSAKEVKAYLRVKLPPMGYIKVNLQEGKGKEIGEKASASFKGDTAVLSNKFLRIVISKEGVMAYSPSGEMFLRSPAYLAGHFASGDKVGGIEQVRAYNEGPLAFGEARGRIGGVPFELRLTLSPVSPVVKVNLKFEFGENSAIGAVGEYPSKPDVPDWARDDLKLRLVMPLSFPNPSFYSQGAFELREPYEDFFPILRYAGAEGDGKGVAIYTDRATSGIFDKNNSTLSIALANGGNFIYAPGNFVSLSGDEEYELSLYFYQGEREKAGICQLADEIAQPVFALPAGQDFKKDYLSLLGIEPENAVVVSALYPMGRGFLLRLWRPYKGEAEVSLRFAGCKDFWLTDMRGNREKKVGEGERARIKVKGNEIVTLYITR
ncbi:MAG: hypothetical protein ACP5QS_01975, partial [bacterium]